MNLLKALVVGMGGLIAVGIAVLAWGLAHHWGRGEQGASISVAAPVSGSAAADPAFSATDVAAPPGTHFEQMAATADRLLLRFSGLDGERIVVVDPRTGRVTGTISVAPGAK